MIYGVMQKLSIIQQTKYQLVLRELPLLEWLIVSVLFIVAINLAIFEFWVTSIAGVLIGIVLIAQARVRLITFDASTNTMRVALHYPLRQVIVQEELLSDIRRAYLRQDDDGSTQIILVHVDGSEMGLSVYSRDTTNWKEAIVIAINTLLHEAHQQDEEAA